MASGSQAYDLSRYEPKVVEQPKVRVVKRAQPVKSVYGVRPITLVMVAMIVVSVTALLLYNNAMIAEVSAEISRKRLMVRRKNWNSWRMKMHG